MEKTKRHRGSVMALVAKIGVIVGPLCLMFGSMAPPASAATAAGPTVSLWTSSCYRTTPISMTGSGGGSFKGAIAETDLREPECRGAAPGRMGARAILVTNGGGICAANPNYKYNSTTTNLVTALAYYTSDCGSRNMRAHSWGAGWYTGGSGSYRYNDAWAPYLLFSMTAIVANQSEARMLESGETMGEFPENAQGTDALPDFIEAVGDSGITGYIRKTDFQPELPDSPEQALAQQTARGANAEVAIPVYAADGKTVVDTFTMR